MQFIDQPIRDFLVAAASPRPIPGGGAVAALTAALAGTMAEMAANFTVGKKKFASVQAEIQDLRDQLSGLRGRLCQLMDEDAAVFTKLQMAQHLPKNSSSEIVLWQRNVNAASAEAAAVPSVVADLCVELLEKARRVAEICNPKLLSDVAVCGHLAMAALEAAHTNVTVNLRGNMETARQLEEENKAQVRRAAAQEHLRGLLAQMETRGATGSPAETGMFEAPQIPS